LSLSSVLAGVRRVRLDLLHQLIRAADLEILGQERELILGRSALMEFQRSTATPSQVRGKVARVTANLYCQAGREEVTRPNTKGFLLPGETSVPGSEVRTCRRGKSFCGGTGMRRAMFLTASLLALLRPAPAAGQDALIATELLGCPTDHSITVNAVAGFDADAFVEYGTTPGAFPARTDTVTVPAGGAIEIVVGGLSPDTRYYYRFCYRRTGAADFVMRDEHTFHTWRPRGSPFRFTVQADSHLYDGQGCPTLMAVAMRNQRNDAPDFVLDLGDTFGDDRHPDSITNEEVWQLHLNLRPYFGMLCHSSPLFLCLGNHEGENGYRLRLMPPNNLAIYGTLAREFYYPNPVPDGFYSGNTIAENWGMGLPENYYAWAWGDALFVVLDAYRHCTASERPKGWDWTIGEQQYEWFRQTLERSIATYKFVFVHHVAGAGRGGVALTHQYEWGGYNADSTTWGFDTERPGWPMPLHQLMVANGVTILFQGHDHLFAKEERDGLVYQEVPMPADSTYQVGAGNAHAYTDTTLMNSGHLRVTVSADSVRVDYVKAVLPSDETPHHPNGEIAYSYTIRAAVPTRVPEEQCLLDAAYPSLAHRGAAVTRITYRLPFESAVTLRVHDVLGRVVAVLVDDVQTAGEKTVLWNAADAASGAYFYLLEAVCRDDPLRRFTSAGRVVTLR
jgi:hypothetical protein